MHRHAIPIKREFSRSSNVLLCLPRSRSLYMLYAMGAIIIIIRPSNTIYRFARISHGLASQSRALSSTTNYTIPPSVPTNEQDIISKLTPLKKILCLCPIPLGRSRVSWSGGDSSVVRNQTMNMNFSQADIPTNQPNVTKYRYGERYAIGAAVSDAYLTHAEPVSLRRGGVQQFFAEMVPSFRCDTHNLGSSPIFHCNLPYFRHDLLRDIGHFDVGAVVIAMPMKPTTNPYTAAPTRMELEQEHKLEMVRGSMMGILQHYISQDGGEFDDDTVPIEEDNKRGQRRGPLGLQGFIDHRMTWAEVLSKTYDADRGSWGHLTKAIQQSQNNDTNSCRGNTFLTGNYIDGSHNVFASISPEIHASVALNAMMEKYTSAFHNSFF